MRQLWEGLFRGTEVLRTSAPPSLLLKIGQMVPVSETFGVRDEWGKDGLCIGYWFQHCRGESQLKFVSLLHSHSIFNVLHSEDFFKSQSNILICSFEKNAI